MICFEHEEPHVANIAVFESLSVYVRANVKINERYSEISFYVLRKYLSSGFDKVDSIKFFLSRVIKNK